MPTPQSDEQTSAADGSEADLVEQRIDVVPDDEQVEAPEVGEADPADVLDQSRSVPMDEDDV